MSLSLIKRSRLRKRFTQDNNNMKYIYLLTFIFIYTASVVGQEESTTEQDTTGVPFVAYWEIGDSYNFQVTKIRRQWKEGISTKNDSSSQVVNFLVLDSTATSYKIKWSTKTDLSEFNIPLELTESMSKYSVTDVIYTTTELGEFVGIENWEEISDMMQNLLTDMMVLIAEDGDVDMATLKGAMQPVQNLYSSKAGLEKLVFKELNFMHFPFGLEYDLNNVIEYEDLLPNMLGGDPIRGDARLYIEDVDFENSFATLKQEMNLNPEDTKRIITSLFKQMNLNNEEFDEALASAEFDIRDNNSYSFYFNPGVPYIIETNRETVMKLGPEDGKRVDILRIELVED